MSGLLGHSPVLPQGPLSQRVGAPAKQLQAGSSPSPLGVSSRSYSSSARCLAPPSAEAPSSSPPRRSSRLPGPPSLAHRRPTSDQALPQLQLAELQRTRAASTATSNASTSRSKGRPSPRALRQLPAYVTEEERQELERSQGSSSLPLPLSFLVRQSHSLLFPFAADSDEEESEDEEADEDDHRLRSRSRALPTTSLISPSANTTAVGRGGLVSIGDAAAIPSSRDAGDVGTGGEAPSFSDWAPGAFALRGDRAKAGSAEAVKGSIGVQWEDAELEGGVTGDAVPSAGGTVTVTDEDVGMLAEEMGVGEEEGEGEGKRQGWRTDSYVRGLMGLWGGLRGHAKAAAIESHEQEQQEEDSTKEGEASEVQDRAHAPQLAFADGDLQQRSLAESDAGADATAAATLTSMDGADVASEQSDMEAVEDDVGPEEEDERLARPKGSVITDHAPPRANTWAIWALTAWRREKQQQQQEEQKQIALQTEGSAPAGANAAVTAPTAPAAAPLSIPDTAPARQLEGIGEATAKASQGEAAEVVRAVRGNSTCSSCGACQEYTAAAGAAAGAPGAKGLAPANSVWVPHTPETMRPFLHLASLAELRSAAVLSRLCHLAYTIPVLNVSVSTGFRWHPLLWWRWSHAAIAVES